MASTLAEPPGETPDLAAEYQRLYDLACDQGDALARLTLEVARQTTDNRATRDLLLLLLGARPPVSRRRYRELQVLQGGA